MITYQISKNGKYGDYRVDQFISGKWENSFDDNWNESQAVRVMNNLIESDHLEYFAL